MTRIALPIVVVQPYRDWLIGDFLRSSQPLLSSVNQAGHSK